MEAANATRDPSAWWMRRALWRSVAAVVLLFAAGLSLLEGSGAVRLASFPRYGDADVVPDIEATHIDASDDVLWIDAGRNWLLDTKRKALQKAPAILTFILRQVPAGFVESDRAQIAVAALKKERGPGILRRRDRRHRHPHQSGDADMKRQVRLEAAWGMGGGSGVGGWVWWWGERGEAGRAMAAGCPCILRTAA